MQRICVFTGSNTGVRAEYQQKACELGYELAARHLGLVYGGASVGLMGILADAVLEKGGEVIGVLPRALFRREIARTDLTKLYEVASMHERKAMMAELADGFIALPGGFGTFDELFEILTWSQIGLHQKPIALLDTANYFKPLLTLINHATSEGFVQPWHSALLLYAEEASSLLTRLEHYTPPEQQSKWNDPPPEP